MELNITPEEQQILDAETKRRVRQALRQIEDAQNKLGDACATLSSLCGAIPEWKSTSTMYDKVKAHWYKIEGALLYGKKAKSLHLDGMATETVLKTLRQKIVDPAQQG